MKTAFIRFTAVLGLAAALGGCVVYEPVPVSYASPTAAFDRSWNAAVGAMQGEGVVIREQDRASGVVGGTLGATQVTARVTTQADGRVRVEFNTSGGGAQSQVLAERLSSSYDRRMGR